MPKRTSSKDILTFTVTIIKETDMAIGCSEHEASEDVEFWLPKSQIEYDESCGEGETIDVQMPRWLADEKGLED
jgi:hypothetical protein